MKSRLKKTANVIFTWLWLHLIHDCLCRVCSSSTCCGNCVGLASLDRVEKSHWRFHPTAWGHEQLAAEVWVLDFGVSLDLSATVFSTSWIICVAFHLNRASTPRLIGFRRNNFQGWRCAPHGQRAVLLKFASRDLPHTGSQRTAVCINIFERTLRLHLLHLLL